MAKPVLTNADAFSFTTLAGEVLELSGALASWGTESRPGLAAHGIMKRAGALHQLTGTEPRKFSYSCSITGPDVTARFRRLLAVIESQPFGRLVDPRLGAMDAVCEGVQAQEDAGEAVDTIVFSIRFSETGLKDAPRPTPTAQAQQASTYGASAATLSAPSGGAIAAAGAAVQARSAGLLLAMSQAETGVSSLLDVDASLAELVTAHAQLDALAAPQPARDAAARCLASALQARNAFLEGRPALVTRTLDRATSLSALAQQLYGARALAAEAEIRRLNRIPKPWSIPAGVQLLLSDPAAIASEVQ